MPLSIIGKGLVVRGKLASECDIQIDGTVEGDVSSAKLTVGEGGAVNGTIVAEHVVIAGAVTGEIRSKTVAMVATARVRADISVDSLAIEAGAQFEGICKRLGANSEAANAEPSFPVKPAAADAKVE